VLWKSPKFLSSKALGKYKLSSSAKLIEAASAGGPPGGLDLPKPAL